MKAPESSKTVCMTKPRERQAKRQKSRAAQAAMHDKERKDRDWAEYDAGSMEKTIDLANARWFSDAGEGAAPAPLGPNLKKKRRQKNIEDAS